MKRFAKSAAKATSHFMISISSLISLMTCCVSPCDEQENEKHSFNTSTEPLLLKNRSTARSIPGNECFEVELSKDSFVLELRDRAGDQDLDRDSDQNIGRISVLEALQYEPDPASIRSISTESNQSNDQSIDMLDISDVPLSVDEIVQMRRYREAQELAVKIRSSRNKRGRFGKLFRNKNRYRNFRSV